MSAYREATHAFLAAQSTLALATVNESGAPEVAPVFYVADEAFALYWLSAASSRHSLNLTARPMVAATIYPAVWNWLDIAGLQIEGQAGIVGDSVEREAALALYLNKFQLPESFAGAIAGSSLYRLRPQWMRWLNNREHFGFKTEIPLP